MSPQGHWSLCILRGFGILPANVLEGDVVVPGLDSLVGALKRVLSVVNGA